MCLTTGMNTFSENPLFLFVDHLADGSPNFATDGKIVELFDTGCDARTPGGAFKILKEPNAAIQDKGSIQTPNVRKPFSVSLRQDKTEVKQNTTVAGIEHKRKNVAGACKSMKSVKPMMWSSMLKDQVSMKSCETTVNARLDSDVGNQSDAENSQYCQRGGSSPEKQRAKPSWTSLKYGGRNRMKTFQSIPNQQKAPGGGATICSTFDGRADTGSTRFATNPRITSPTKMGKVTSGASLNYEVHKFVNRAVDKDSLSNCSRQFEMAKTPGASFFPKAGYASRLPRSAGTAEFLPAKKLPSKSSNLIETRKETTVKPESKIGMSKIGGGTDHELQDEDVRSKPMKPALIVSPGEQRNYLEGETKSKITLKGRPTLNSEKKYGYGVGAKLSAKTRDLNDQNSITLSSSRSKMNSSKVPPSRFNRNIFLGGKDVQKPGDVDKVIEVNKVSDGQEFKSNEILSSRLDRPDTTQCPRLKCHNSTRRGTKLPTPRTPSIVPKLMDEFVLQENQNKISECLPRNLKTRSSSPEAKMEKERMKADSNGKPSSTSGLRNGQANGRLIVNRSPQRVREVLSSETPVPGEVTECMEAEHQTVDHAKLDMSKIHVESASSRTKAVQENDKEIELKIVSEDMPTTVSHKPASKSSPSSLKSSNSKESKLRHSLFALSATGSKVPRPVVTKRIPKKVMARNLPERKWPKKQESSTLREPSKNFAKSSTKAEAEPPTPPTKKSVENVSGSEDITESTIVSKENEDEDLIPIMNPALYNIRSFATQYHKRGDSENDMPQKTSRVGKLESWINGHEQAYFKGRAIGLKVASMAQAAKENLKREFVRSGLKCTTPVSLPDRSQEIVDIAVSIIEKAFSEKENKIHSPSVRRDQVFSYHDYDESKWNGEQWLT